MKPKEYIVKYKLDADPVFFNHKEFISDITIDFTSMVELQSSRTNFNYSNFQVIVSDIKAKFDAISNKSVGFRSHEKKLWNFFFASVVVKARDHYFGAYLKQKADEHRKKQQVREEREQFFRSMHDDFLSRLLSQYFVASLAPVEEFALLNITDSNDYTLEMVKANFRDLAKKHHPDAGGKVDAMQKLIEAKNKCMAYLEAA